MLKENKSCLVQIPSQESIRVGSKGGRAYGKSKEESFKSRQKR